MNRNRFSDRALYTFGLLLIFIGGLSLSGGLGPGWSLLFLGAVSALNGGHMILSVRRLAEDERKLAIMKALRSQPGSNLTLRGDELLDAMRGIDW